MNKIYLIGNLCKDPELTETANGTAVCKFSIAVNRPKSGDKEQETDYFNCTAWRGTGETIAKYTHKGNKIAINGSVQLRNYEGKDGIKRQAVDVIVSDFEFLTPKSNNGEQTDKPAPKQKPKLEAFDNENDSPF